MTHAELLDLIRARVQAAGSRRALARELHVSAQYLGDVLNGTRRPGAKLLGALGLRRVVAYEPVGRSKRRG